MTITLSILCLLIAAVIFAIATWWSPARGNLIAAWLFFLTVGIMADQVKVAF